MMSPGDIALFSWNGKFRSCARVSVLTENADLARELWGTDEEGATWQLIYFRTEPVDCAISYDRFNEAVCYKRNFVPQGFTVLNEQKSRAALAGLDLPMNEVVSSECRGTCSFLS